MAAVMIGVDPHKRVPAVIAEKTTDIADLQ
jgi:hypothetical protein